MRPETNSSKSDLKWPGYYIYERRRLTLKNSSSDFHISKERKLLILVSFSLLSAIALTLFGITSGPYFSQLNALLRSKYLYSVNTKNGSGNDVYLQYDAGIGFSLSRDALIGINADVIMQSAESVYSESVYWNTKKLEPNEVAISEGLSLSNNLKTGDVLFSKHVVDGTTSEYVIACVLPSVTTARYTDESNYSDGLIIMGYDSRYYDSISHNCLVFSTESIEELSLRLHQTPVNILYRTDEIKRASRMLIPYVLVTIALVILLSVGAVFFLSKDISRNFKRLISLGFDKKRINASYHALVCGFGSISILLSFFGAYAFLVFICKYTVDIVPLVISIIIEFIALISTAQLSRERLWRS